MVVQIVPGTPYDLFACSAILADSPLGIAYFKAGTPDYFGDRVLGMGFEKNEVYVARNEAGDCVAFGWIERQSMFHRFPYFHILTVATAYRNQGVGTQFMRFFEEECADPDDKLFLIVADFNSDARRLYEKLGYEPVGTIRDLYVPGVNECLMVKYKHVSG